MTDKEFFEKERDAFKKCLLEIERLKRNYLWLTIVVIALAVYVIFLH